jgi:pectinesterase
MINRLGAVALLILLFQAVLFAAGGTIKGVTADIIVAADGTGDFKTVQQAVDSIPVENAASKIIFIKPGTYHEKIHITQPLVHLIGENPEKTILTFDDFARKKAPMVGSWELSDRSA